MKTLLIVTACLTFGYASAQLDPKTSQGTAFDTVAQPLVRKPADKTVIANKSILKRNTLDAGMGRPDPVKTDINTNEPVPNPPLTTKNRVEAVVDTITPQKKK